MSEKWRVVSHPPNVIHQCQWSPRSRVCINPASSLVSRSGRIKPQLLVDLDIAAAECAAAGVAGAQLDGKLVNPFSWLCKVINIDDEVV